MIVKDFMEKVYTIEKNIPLSKVAQIMSNKNVGEIVFYNDGKVKGIVTRDDLIKNFDKKKNFVDVMTTKIVTINEGETIDDALELMNAKSIKRLPVMNAKGEMVGMVRLIDIARHADELEEDFFFG